MDGKGHLITYIIAVIILMICNFTWLHFTTDWVFFVKLLSMFVINCDLDLVIGSLLGKKAHRNALTHSALLSLIYYWAMRDYITITDAGLLTLLFFFPVLIHLCADFTPHTIIDAVVDDIGESIKAKGKKIKQGNEKTVANWKITFRPLFPYTLSFYGSLLWIGGNIGFMIIFILIKFQIL